MITMTLADVTVALGGEYVDSGLSAEGERPVTRVSIDSRATAEGDLFVAIRGEKFDGHEFVEAALSHGAVAAVVSSTDAIPVGTRRVIRVDDTVAALGRLAHEVLHRAGCTVIAVTGSSGKTTTKDMLAHVLGSRGRTVAPPGSYNNEIGVPMTVLSIDAGTEHLVLEMGARGAGHIDYLCSIATPDIAVVLNVGSAHVGEFGSTELIAEAKAEIVAACRPDGVVVLNADDPLVAAMATRSPARVLTFGVDTEDDRADVTARAVRLDEAGRPSFVLEYLGSRTDVALQSFGLHQVSNALAVAAVALALGATTTEVAAALGSFEHTSGLRMEVSTTPQGVTVVNDAYNANPESMTAALTALASMSAGRRSWAVLGEMRELGPASGEAHARIGALAVEMGVTRLVVVGSGARGILESARRVGMSQEDSVFVPDVEAASALLASDVRSGDVVLIKASRAIGLERVATALASGAPA